MQKVFQMFCCLLLLLASSFTLIAQISDNKNKKFVNEKENKLTNDDYKEIVKLLYPFFEGESSNLEKVGVYFEKVPNQFKQIFISKIKTENKKLKIKILTKKQLQLGAKNERNDGQVTLNLSTNQPNVIPKKLDYFEIKFIKQTKKSAIILVASYSPCYSSGEKYSFKKIKKWRYKTDLVFIDECLTGNCVDGECLPMIEKKEDDPPPPLPKKKPK